MVACKATTCMYCTTAASLSIMHRLCSTQVNRLNGCPVEYRLDTSRSIEFRLRLPGIDLWTTHKPAWSEVALQFMLLGAVYLHK